MNNEPVFPTRPVHHGYPEGTNGHGTGTGAGMSTAPPKLKAPFPAFGGKSRAADMVWPRLSPAHSPARNYIEPFCFSAAMLLLRPGESKTETINDLNSFVANFWRAIKAAPHEVAEHADWPVNEDDLHARHAWLVRSHEAAEKLERVRTDPEYYDARIAGWWCWGACMWIGSGWCDEGHRNSPIDQLNSGRGMLPQNLPELNSEAGNAAAPFARQPARGQAGWGVNALGTTGDTALAQKRPRATGAGHGPGVHQSASRPRLADAYSRGRGVHGNDTLTNCERRRLWLMDWFERLSNRLQSVRVCCGHWDRVCDSDSTLTRLGKTAVFLDPPYRKKLADGSVNRSSHIYANDRVQDVDALVDEVQAWCLKWGPSPEIRIAVCGLEGEYPELDAAGWEKVTWKSQGGYGNRNKENKNAARERIWFNAAASAPEQPQRELFA